MKITLIMVSSLDGKTTRGDSPDVRSWTSPEDHKHFINTRDKSSLIIMGRKTYEAGQKHLKLSPNILRVVLTRSPDEFADRKVSGQLEFTSEKPTQLIHSLERRGYAAALLTGGSHVNTIFLKAHLIQEILLTVEPRILGTGNPIFGENDLDMRLTLMESQTLNTNGTILLHYKVQYEPTTN